MPAQNGLRLDDEQGIFPAFHPAGEYDEEAAIRSREAWSLDRAVEDDELLAQQEVLRDQLRFTASEISDGAERRAVNKRLGPARDSGAGRLYTAVYDRLDPSQDADHYCSPFMLLRHSSDESC